MTDSKKIIFYHDHWLNILFNLVQNLFIFFISFFSQKINFTKLFIFIIIKILLIRCNNWKTIVFKKIIYNNHLVLLCVYCNWEKLAIIQQQSLILMY